MQREGRWLLTAHHVKSNSVLFGFVSTWSYLFWEAAMVPEFTWCPKKQKSGGQIVRLIYLPCIKEIMKS